MHCPMDIERRPATRPGFNPGQHRCSHPLSDPSSLSVGLSFKIGFNISLGRYLRCRRRNLSENRCVLSIYFSRFFLSPCQKFWIRQRVPYNDFHTGIAHLAQVTADREAALIAFRAAITFRIHTILERSCGAAFFAAITRNGFQRSG